MIGGHWKQQIKSKAALWVGGEGICRRRAVADALLTELTVRFCGRTVKVVVRPNTYDEDLVRMLLRRDGMYALPDAVKPRVIFDVGANIGVAAVFFAVRYPDAQVHCFEPLPENVELLRRNVAAVGGRVRIYERGLGDVAGTFDYELSADPKSYGGGTF